MQYSALIAQGYDETSPLITRIHVTYSGVRFLFSEQNKLTLYTPDETLAVSVQSYEVEDQSLIVRFEQSISIRFAEQGTNGISISIETPDSLAQYETIQISLSPNADYAKKIDKENPEIIEFLDQETTYILVLPPFSQYVEQSTDLLQIALTNRQTTLKLSESVESGIRVEQVDILEQLPVISAESHTNQIEQYIDEAYLGWTDTRLNGASGTWDRFTEPPIFSEEIIVSLLREAWLSDDLDFSDDEYSEQAIRMRSIAQLHLSELSFNAMAYLGFMQDIVPRQLIIQNNRLESLLNATLSQDIRILEQPDLIPFTYFTGTDELITRLENFLLFVEPSTLAVEYAIYLFEHYTLKETYPRETQSWLLGFESIGEEQIIPNLIRVDGELFIKTGINQVNTLLSLRAGLSFIRYGEERTDENMINLGRNLVQAVLNLKSEQNTIPNFIYLGSDNAETSQDHFNPESAYSFLRVESPGPHLTGLTTSEQRSWAWGVGEIANSDFSDDELQILINSPPNRTSYFLFHNIAPFDSMTLFGLQWRNDPTFEIYARGRHYDEELRSVMIKHNDSIPQRTITFTYTNIE